MGCVSLRDGNRNPSRFDRRISSKAEGFASLKSQTSGFYGFSDLFSQFANGNVYACAGIGDWLTQSLKSQGHPLEFALPKEGALGVAELISNLKR